MTLCIASCLDVDRAIVDVSIVISGPFRRIFGAVTFDNLPGRGSQKKTFSSVFAKVKVDSEGSDTFLPKIVQKVRIEYQRKSLISRRYVYPPDS